MASEKNPNSNPKMASKLGNSSVAFFPSELKHSDIKKRIIQCFRKNEYDQLKKDLVSYGLTDEKIAAFFLSEEGKEVFMWSLIHTTTDESLKFLIATVPVLTLQNILSKNNFSVLQAFLNAQVSFERMNWYTQAIEETQINKFKALLSIDKDATMNFMQENSADSNLSSEKIRINFENASKQFAEKNSPS